METSASFEARSAPSPYPVIAIAVAIAIGFLQTDNFDGDSDCDPDSDAEVWRFLLYFPSSPRESSDTHALRFVIRVGRILRRA
jgi:hypothetical protein